MEENQKEKKNTPTIQLKKRTQCFELKVKKNIVIDFKYCGGINSNEMKFETKSTVNNSIVQFSKRLSFGN